MARHIHSLRGLLLLIGVGAIAYVAAMALYLGLVVVPTAAAVTTDTQEILEANGAIEARVGELEAAVARVELNLRSRTPDYRMPRDSAESLIASTEELMLRNVGLSISSLWRAVPDTILTALARATDAETQVTDHLILAVEALQRGDHDQAVGQVVEADNQREAAQVALNVAREAAFRSAIQREQEHEEASAVAARLTAGWGVLGVLLLTGLFLVLRDRVFRPMEMLETSLGRVAEGDLESRLEVGGLDELDRLADIFNQMTGVLRTREDEAKQRQQGVVERYSRILEETASELLALDATTLKLLEANRRALEHMGFTADEVQGLETGDLWNADRGLVDDTLANLVDGSRESCVFFAEQRRKDGSTYPVEVTAYRAPTHQPPAIIAICHDLTERLRLENIQEQLARFALEKGAILQSGDVASAFRAITEMAATTMDVRRVSIWRLENDGIRCADAYDRESGTHSGGEFFTAETHAEYFSALHSERTIDARDAHTDARTAGFSESYLTPNGVGAVLDAPVRVGGRIAGVVSHGHVGGARAWSAEENVLAAAIAGFVTQVLEAADRQRAERALLESEQRYRATFEQAAVGMCETDARGRFLRANPRLQEMFGYTGSELRELSWQDLTHADDRDYVERGLKTLRDGSSPSFQRECRCRRKDGSELWVDVSAAPVWQEDGTVSRIIGVTTDMSEARDLQAQLIHAQRMDSIGRLAGGIAHDFNNLLTAILGHAELGASTVTEEDPVFADLREIEESALRASGLTRQLLTFARRQLVEPKTVRLDHLTERAERLLRRLIGEDVELVTELGAPGATIRIDPGQFEQVIVNLAVNARDAMPGGGTLKIASRVVRLGEPKDLEAHDLESGSYVELTVEDTGFGMDEVLQSRIFEPFFTTKAAGEGTGLGLATCYGIVGQAGGRIRVQSTPGEGTRFKILLPALNGDLPAAETSGLGEREEGGMETVLVAEDEESVRRLVVESLKRKGYSVLPAADGSEALSVAESFEGSIDALVTDIVMPKMRGPALAARLRSSRPGVKVLFMSGYSGSTDTEEALTTSDSTFLPKPFTPTQLAARVRELLDGVDS